MERTSHDQVPNVPQSVSRYSTLNDVSYSNLNSERSRNTSAASATRQLGTTLSSNTSQLYRALRPYQTRILRLHPAKNDEISPLTCDLLTADFLDIPQYEPLGIRAQGSGIDYSTKFTALSYWWGPSPPEWSHKLVCNGIDFPITRYLYEALHAIRPSDNTMHVWVDAVCINQNDPSEKAVQVANMLRIYQKAREVIAWLGPAHEYFQYILEPLDWSEYLQNRGSQHLKDIPDINKVRQCLLDFYTRPFFQRVWIQQEVFAAKRLFLQCGKHQFSKLSPLMMNPGWIDDFEVTDSGIETSQKADRTKHLKQAHDRLYCFQRFSRTVPHGRHLVVGQRYLHFVDNEYPDFVDTILLFRTLQSTNEVDYIYAVVGMTRFPAEPMTWSKWMQERKERIFIPIDYEANPSQILCAVTWCLLMKGGLSMLAPFKVFPCGGSHSSVTLPSWTIDWRLAAQCCHLRPDILQSLDTHPPSPRTKLHDRRWIGIDEPWKEHYSSGPRVGSNNRIVHETGPPARQSHADFRLNNQNTKLPFDVIKIRGLRRHDYLIQGKEIVEKRSIINKTWWRFREDLDLDLVVVQSNTGHLLLLKPSGIYFRIVAMLVNAYNYYGQMYNRWNVRDADDGTWRPMANESISQGYWSWYSLTKEKNYKRLEDFLIA